MQKLLTTAALSLFLTACGGGGSSTSATDDSSSYNVTPSGDVSGIELPSSLSVVTAADESGSGLRAPFAYRSAAKAYDEVDTDYSTDPVHTYVYDASMESLDTVNMILCLMEQTRASDMVNQGPYIALVNEDKCEQGEGQSGNTTGQSSSAESTEYNTWTIVSTRASETDPQQVKIWVPGFEDPEDPMDAQTILVEVTATEGVSASKPFGSFDMNFKGIIDAEIFGGPSGVQTEVMRGSLNTVDNAQGKPQFRFVNLGGDSLASISGAGFSFEEAANVILDDAQGNSGVALTHRAESFSDGFNTHQDDSSFAIAFDADYLLRGKDENGDDLADSQTCKSRNDYDTQVWRYNLYHQNDGNFGDRAVTGGQLVELNSGFPFRYDSNNDGADDSHGWVGYHGVWTESGVLDDGTVITQFDYSSDSTIEHTVNMAPGKMIRRSAHTDLLSNYQGDEFQYWGEHPSLNIWGQWLVTVDTNNDFNIIASFEWGDNGPIISETVDHDDNPGTAEVNASTALVLNNYYNIWLWSEALGGNVVYVHDQSVAADNRSITFYAEEFISPTDDELFANGSSLTLYCYDRCLKGGLTQDDVDSAMYEHELFYQYMDSYFTYTLSQVNGKVILIDNSNGELVSAVGLDMSAIGNDWGINTGEMLTSPLPNATEHWRVYDEPLTYRWETGSNDWNLMVTVSDTHGNVASFDRPLQFNYTHSAANDANSSSHHDGKRFMIGYGGVGELWGFPWIEDEETHRWYSEVTLKDGTVLSNGDNSFVVKGIEMEQSLQDDSSGCGSLSIDSLFTDSSLELPTEQDIGSVSFSLNQKPDVTDAPAVIEGEIQ